MGKMEKKWRNLEFFVGQAGGIGRQPENRRPVLSENSSSAVSEELIVVAGCGTSAESTSGRKELAMCMVYGHTPAKRIG